MDRALPPARHRGYDTELNHEWFGKEADVRLGSGRGEDPPEVRVTGVAGKPRLLVIDRDSSQGKSSLDCLSDSFELVMVADHLQGAVAAARPEVRGGLR